MPGRRALVVLRGAIAHKNLWLVDLDTGAERQLTDFASDFVVRDFDVSADGRELVVERVDQRSDVVLLDLGLPVMDGFEVAQRLRELPDSARMRIVAITGYGQDTDRRRTRAAGFDRHLVKPVDIARLGTWLRRLQVAPKTGSNAEARP